MASAEPIQIMTPLVKVGDGIASGAYILRIHVRALQTVSIGRRPRSVNFPAGEYLYVGSARGPKGSLPLPHRLIRHATRSPGKAAHAILPDLVAGFRAWGLPPQQMVPIVAKRLFWHIDYFLDCVEVEITQAYAIGAHLPLEQPIASVLENDSATRLVQAGLGASDHRGHTHLLSVQAPPSWWLALPERLQVMLAANYRAGRDRGSLTS
jgi:Uri superfamily endonuclease